MLLKVDVYANDWKKGSPPSRSFQVSLASSTAQDEGTLLSIGRKNSDVLLSTDKTVSRLHVKLLVVATPGAGSDGTPHPSTSNEKNACRKDGHHGMAVVLENIGKIGTFIVEEPDQKLDSGEIGADSHDEDQTDDEEQASQAALSQALTSGGILLSQASRSLVSPKSTLKPIQTQNQKVVLESLSVEGGRSILQCGKLGSTIVLQRQFHHVCHTNLTVTQVKSLDTIIQTNYRRMGWLIDKTVIAKATKLVVSGKLVSTNKLQIAAWYAGVPIVLPKYVEAVCSKTKGESGTVQTLSPDEYLVSESSAAFRGEKPNPQLWSSCNYISAAGTNDEEIVSMASCAGASAVPCDSVKAVDKVLGSLPHCFSLSGTKKLQKHMKASGVLMLSASNMAKSLLNQVLPTHPKGKTVGVIRVASSAPGDDGSRGTSRNSQHGEAEILSPRSEPEWPKSTQHPEEQSLQSPTAVDSVDRPQEHKTNERTNLAVDENELSHRDESPDTRDRPLSLPPSSADGWLSAAPQGKERQKYRRSVSEIEKATGQSETTYHPITEELSNLTLENATETRPKSASQRTTFSAFRKNSVAPRFDLKQVVLEAVSHVSEDQQMIESQRKDLSRQQRRADELFQDPVAPVRKRRKR